jgi:hypothetical protein
VIFQTFKAQIAIVRNIARPETTNFEQNWRGGSDGLGHQNLRVETAAFRRRRKRGLGRFKALYIGDVSHIYEVCSVLCASDFRLEPSKTRS